jgi:hypothetical protein
LGELGVASATTIKVIAIVVVSMGLLQFISKKTGLNVKKQGA